MCFSCFTVYVLKNFGVTTYARETSWLVPPNAISVGRPATLTDAVTKTLSVKIVDVIRPVSTTLMIVLYDFIFFASFSRILISSNKYSSISVNFFQQYAYGSYSVVGFRFR